MKTGICIGRFDIIHNGHIYLFKEAKKICDYFIIGVVKDSFSGFNKKKIVFSLSERKEILEAIKYIDKVVAFNSKEELLVWIDNNNPDLLIAGDEKCYREKQPLKNFFREGNIRYIKGRKNSSSKIKRKIEKMKQPK